MMDDITDAATRRERYYTAYGKGSCARDCVHDGKGRQNERRTDFAGKRIRARRVKVRIFVTARKASQGVLYLLIKKKER